MNEDSTNSLKTENEAKADEKTLGRFLADDA